MKMNKIHKDSCAIVIFIYQYNRLDLKIRIAKVSWAVPIEDVFENKGH